MKHLGLGLGLPLAFVLLCACSSDEDVNVGVNDVRRACEVRASWPTPDAEDCVACQTSAILERCECEKLREFSGACVEAANRVRNEPACTQEIENCARACPRGDCGCVEGCYAQAEACQRVAAGRDGCVADVCAQHCGAM